MRVVRAKWLHACVTIRHGRHVVLGAANVSLDGPRVPYQGVGAGMVAAVWIIAAVASVFLLRHLLLDRRAGRAFSVHVLRIALQEVVNPLDADLDRARRLVLIDILEREVRRAGPLDDRFDHRVDRRIVPAFEAGQLQRDEVWMARRKPRGPDIVISGRLVAVLPGPSAACSARTRDIIPACWTHREFRCSDRDRDGTHTG
jgi:hypothetical protein